MDKIEIERKLNIELECAKAVNEDYVDCISVELIQSIADLISKQEAQINYLQERIRIDEQLLKEYENGKDKD